MLSESIILWLQAMPLVGNHLFTFAATSVPVEFIDVRWQV